jgi:hypothetical protein
MRTCEHTGERHSHRLARASSTLQATRWYRRRDTGGSGNGNDRAEELGIMKEYGNGHHRIVHGNIAFFGVEGNTSKAQG